MNVTRLNSYRRNGANSAEHYVYVAHEYLKLASAGTEPYVRRQYLTAATAAYRKATARLLDRLPGTAWHAELTAQIVRLREEIDAVQP